MSLFEDSARYPMLIVGAGAALLVKLSPPLSQVDLFPTLAELCGVTRPTNLQGQSLVPMLKDKTQTGRGWALTQVTRGGGGGPQRNKVGGGFRRSRCLRQTKGDILVTVFVQNAGDTRSGWRPERTRTLRPRLRSSGAHKSRGHARPQQNCGKVGNAYARGREDVASGVRRNPRSASGIMGTAAGGTVKSVVLTIAGELTLNVGNPLYDFVGMVIP